MQVSADQGDGDLSVGYQWPRESDREGNFDALGEGVSRRGMEERVEPCQFNERPTHTSPQAGRRMTLHSKIHMHTCSTHTYTRVEEVDYTVLLLVRANDGQRVTHQRMSE